MLPQHDGTPSGAAPVRAEDPGTEIPSARTGVMDTLLAMGVDRRRFLTYCAGLTGVLALPSVFAPRVAEAVAAATRPTVVWLELADCTGDTESLLRARDPSIASLILDVLSIDYHETLMAAAGRAAEADRTTALARSGHILVVEGAVPTGAGGAYCVIAGRSAEQLLREAAAGAAAIINVGTCSAYGGLPAASPNPTHAVAVGDVVSGVPIVNLPGCPMNVDNLTATVAHYLTFKQLPPTDDQGRPLFAYGDRIHDNCPRRGHFDAGRFALAWGDEGHRNGWCLYRMGCKGPSAFHNCPIQRWNGATSWPVAAGHGCAGCSEAGFWDNLTPLYDRLPHLRAAGIDLTAEKAGLAVVGTSAAAFTAHGIGKIIQNVRAGRRERAAALAVTTPSADGPLAPLPAPGQAAPPGTVSGVPAPETPETDLPDTGTAGAPLVPGQPDRTGDAAGTTTPRKDTRS